MGVDAVTSENCERHFQVEVVRKGNGPTAIVSGTGHSHPWKGSGFRLEILPLGVTRRTEEKQVMPVGRQMTLPVGASFSVGNWMTNLKDWYFISSLQQIECNNALN